MKKGEVTAYFALVFLLLLSFIASIMDAASIQMAKSYRRADMNRAMESVFAEYQKNLLQEFGIFGMEGSYETGSYEEQQILDRIQFYGGGSNEIKINRIRFLTDTSGQAFYEQVVTYMKQKTGIGFLEDNLGMTNSWDQQVEQSRQYEEQEKETGKELEDTLAEGEVSLPEEDNPLSNVSKIKQGSLVELVMPKEKDVSQKTLGAAGAEVVSQRTLRTGYGTFPEFEKEVGTMAKLLYGEYLLEHFSSAVSEEETKGLSYEIEYILFGKESDKENLEAMVKKLLLLKFVPNYLHVQSDPEKKAEADALALTLSTLVAMPAAQAIVSQALLLAWAFGESIMDIRSLLNGGKVPVVKTKESWQLSLTGLMKLGTEEDEQAAKDSQEGLTYKEHLRMLLFLEQKEELVMKSMDMAECRIRQEEGLSWFRMDACVANMDVFVKANLRRQITYDFSVSYGYR